MKADFKGGILVLGACADSATRVDFVDKTRRFDVMEPFFSNCGLIATWLFEHTRSRKYSPGLNYDE